MNFGSSASRKVDELSKTVGLRKELSRAECKWVMVICPLFASSRTYADGVPEQDFPVKAASRSVPWTQAGNAS